MILTFAIFFLYLAIKYTRVVILDGMCFMAAGAKVLDGRWNELYIANESLAPWAYLPHAAGYFALLIKFFGLVKGHKIHMIFSALLATGALTVLVLRLQQRYGATPQNGSVKVATTKSLSLLVLGVLASFGFIFWESFYVGQVDVLIMSLALIQALLPQTGRWPWLRVFIIGLLASVKPQFGLLVLPLIVEGKYLETFCAGLCSASLIVLFYLINLGNIPLSAAPMHLQQFSEVSRMLSGIISPVNQSLQSVFRMMFVASEYIGRFSPRFHAPGLIDHKLFFLPAELVTGMIWLARALVLGVLTKALINIRGARGQRMDPLKSLVVVLLALPVLSPVFWQLHFVFLFPAALYLAFVARVESKLFRNLMIAALSLLVLVNPLLVGGKSSDALQSFGASLVAALIMFALAVRFLKRESLHQS